MNQLETNKTASIEHPGVTYVLFCSFYIYRPQVTTCSGLEKCKRPEMANVTFDTWSGLQAADAGFWNVVVPVSVALIKTPALKLRRRRRERGCQGMCLSLKLCFLYSLLQNERDTSSTITDHKDFSLRRMEVQNILNFGLNWLHEFVSPVY